MTNLITTSPIALVPSLEAAWRDVDSSFERFCLTAGIEAMEQMLCEDAQRLAGPRHSRGERVGHRWGATKGKIGFHGGKVVVRRPRVRSEGHEVALPIWRAAQAEDWLGRWAMNLMLINVSTRKFRRSVRLPEGDVPAAAGDGTSKSAASRRFVALSAERMAEWMASDLSRLDLLVIQIDGLHIGHDLVLVAVRSTRPVTWSSACPSHCTPQCARRCDKPGNSTTPTRPSGCCAISPAGSSTRRPALPPASSKGSTRC